MANSILVTATQRGSGKSTIALGLINMLERTLGRVGYFKPVCMPSPDGVDPDVQLMKDALGLDFPLKDMAPVTMDEVTEALASGKYDQLLDRIIEAYQKIQERSDFVVCEGTDYFGAMASLEFNINADLSKNLSAPILLVTTACNTANGECCEAMLKNIHTVKESFDEKSCEFFGVVINRAEPKAVAEMQRHCQDDLAKSKIRVVGVIPKSEVLEKPRLDEVAAELGATVISGRERLNVAAQDVIVAAMNIDHVLERLKAGALVVTPGDRDDVVLGLAAAYASPSVPNPSGVVMTGGFEPGPHTKKLIVDITKGQLPILKVDSNTYETAVRVSSVKPRLHAHQRMRTEAIKTLLEEHLQVAELAKRETARSATRMTPKQFLHRILDIARQDLKHIVLPEGEEERMLRAAAVLLERKACTLTLLGSEQTIRQKINHLGLGAQLEAVRIIDPTKSELHEKFAKRYVELRASAKKPPTMEAALDLMNDVSFFGTMMVQEKLADGMVSGSVHTTAHTLRPALEFVKTREGVKIASSIFFMCLPDSVLVYGDCAVNPNPTAEELCDIALASAETAQAFQIEPLVAMLSYSTGDSGKGDDVDKVREATRLAKAAKPNLLIEGPIQYDAAVDADVAKTKLPNSKVAGAATVFIFPDLNTGNVAYKAVQRSARAIAVGPVMQGLRKPVNDLSRGCTVADIVNTVIITAIQAQRS